MIIPGISTGKSLQGFLQRFRKVFLHEWIQWLVHGFLHANICWDSSINLSDDPFGNVSQDSSWNFSGIFLGNAPVIFLAFFFLYFLRDLSINSSRSSSMDFSRKIFTGILIDKSPWFFFRNFSRNYTGTISPHILQWFIQEFLHGYVLVHMQG